jgi:pimeloyl-ACP methyl ester carboxylesterase
MIWRQDGAEMLDKLGPSIIVTHSAGGPFGWIVAEARPNLVKGIIAIEGAGAPFQGQNIWGLSDVPVAYDPPVSDPAQIKLKRVTPEENVPGINPYNLQEEPAHKLKNLLNIPVVLVTSEGSFASPGSPGAAAYLKQAGVKAEELRLVNQNIHGNGHMMMVEKNNREVLNAILRWVDANVSKTPAAARPHAKATGANTSAMKLSQWGYFWVGTNNKPMPYGTILSGQMFVQYFKPAVQRSQYPVILVHGGSGQMLHYMGAGDGAAGWAHYYVQAGYPVYLVDRPGHGRAPFHPDALGPIGNQPAYTGIVADTRRAAAMPNKQWPGTTGEVGDPLLDQFMASQNGAMQDNVLAQTMWAKGGAEILDRIGPAIVQVHAAGGPFSWLVANERPNLVKAIVNVEGGGGANAAWGLTATPLAYDPPAFVPDDLKFRQVAAAGDQPAYRLQDGQARKLKNLSQMPILYVVAERSGRSATPTVEFLKQAGCTAEAMNLKDKNILGNGHFMMIEKNNKQVFDAIRGWVEQKLPLKA